MLYEKGIGKMDELLRFDNLCMDKILNKVYLEIYKFEIV